MTLLSSRKAAFRSERAYAHIFVAVSVKAAWRFASTPRWELCEVSKKRRWDWILKASFGLGHGVSSAFVCGGKGTVRGRTDDFAGEVLDGMVGVLDCEGVENGYYPWLVCGRMGSWQGKGLFYCYWHFSARPAASSPPASRSQSAARSTEKSARPPAGAPPSPAPSGGSWPSSSPR